MTVFAGHLPAGMKVDDLRRALLDWYRRHRRPLPWRGTADPYRIWISEVMLQQTRVETVLPYYHRFVARFPDPFALAAASETAVLKAWEGLGYYARARSLRHAAQRIVREHNGRIPGDYHHLRQLPGIGDYIAAAVSSIAFGAAHAVVDGNVKRVLSRLFAFEAPINAPASAQTFQTAANLLLDHRTPGTFNQAMMELGALVCRVRDPDCASCALFRFCQAARSNAVSAFPKRKASRQVPRRHMVAGIVWKGRQVLIVRRISHGLLGGLWELPGGEIRNGEGAAAACRRVIHETTGVVVEGVSKRIRLKHAFTHLRMCIDLFECRFAAGRICLNGPADGRWAAMDELADLPLTTSSRKLLASLEKAD